MSSTKGNRELLRFANAVRDAFRFVREHGLIEADANPTFVSFRNDRVFLNVYHGRSSYELGVEVGELGEDAGYSMSAIIRTWDPEAAKSYRKPIATTAEEVQRGLEQLAKQFQELGMLALAGESEFFQRLAAQRRDWAAAYAREVLYDQLAPRAAEVFRLRNYPLAVELFEQIESSLSPAEQAKLDYARRKS